jgi:hypothetical protein
MDAFLLKMRVIGPICQCLFREETCHRVDIGPLYLKTIPDLTQKLAEEIAGDKGVKLADQNECAPILGDLYWPLRKRRTEPGK